MRLNFKYSIFRFISFVFFCIPAFSPVKSQPAEKIRFIPKFDTVLIKVDESFLGSYPSKSVFYYATEDTLILLAHNPKKNQLDRIDIKKRVQLPPVVFNTNGPNKVPFFVDFAARNNLIYLYSFLEPEICCIDMNGTVIRRYKPKIPDNWKSQLTFAAIKKTVISRDDYHPIMNIDNNIAYIPIYPIIDIFTEGYFKFPNYLEVDLHTGVSRISDIRFPSDLQNKNNYGDLIHSSIVRLNNNLVVVYGYSSNLFEKSGKILSGFANDNQNKEVKAKPISEVSYRNMHEYIKHYDTFHFGTIQKDLKSSCIIRTLHKTVFEEDKNLSRRHSQTIVSCYDYPSWHLTSECVINENANPFLYNKKLFLSEEMTSTDKGDFFRILITDLNSVSKEK